MSARKSDLSAKSDLNEAAAPRDTQGLTPSLEQRRELGAARRAFDEVRPHGWQDAEAAYSKDNSLAREAGSGRVNRAIRALQLETELRTDPQRRADRFVEDWRKLDQTSRRQYEAGDIMAHKATRRAMGDMAKSLERDPQLESILANRKRELGIAFELRPSNSAMKSPSMPASTLDGDVGSACRTIRFSAVLSLRLATARRPLNPYCIT